MKSEDARRSLCASEPQTRLIFYVFANDRHSNWRYSEGCLECWHEHKYDKKTPLDYLMIDHNLHFNIKLNCTIVESRARPLKVNCAITFCVSYTDEMRLAAWLAHWHHFAMKHWSAGHPLNPRRHSPTFFFFFLNGNAVWCSEKCNMRKLYACCISKIELPQAETYNKKGFGFNVLMNFPSLFSERS